jgi:hypothetical protein
MVAVGDDLAVVGDFAGSVRVYDTATMQWQDVTPGGISGAAAAIAVQPGGFCVAGSFDSIDNVAAENAACWNGSAWSALGAGLPGGVAVLARASGGTWYAGGTITFIVDPMTGEYEAGIARLTGGTWQALAGGIDNGFINEVRAIAFDGADVLVGGHFQTAGFNDVPASHLARFANPGGWSEVGGGLANDVGVFLPSIVGGGDLAIATDGTLWVGGLFTRAGGEPAVNLTRITPAGVAEAVVGPHTVLGVGGFVDALALDGSRVIAGGGFAFAGRTPAANLGALEANVWSELGGGVRGIVRDVERRASGAIAIAGELEIEGEPAAYAEWDGAQWRMPGGRVDGVGFTIAEAGDGTLWLGGDLFTASGGAVSNAIRLTGDTWTRAGDFDGRVSAIAIDGDDVIVGGTFTTVDAMPLAGLAVRSGSGAWAALGAGGLGGELSYVNAIAVSPALGVIVGGQFPSVGGVTAEDLARWDGTAWRDLGAGFVTDDFGFVSALLPYGHGVFVAGGFPTAGGAAGSRNLGWYDGAAWHALETGLADLAEAMVVFDDVLYVGGPFTAAGDYPASGMAAWDFRAQTPI